VVIRANDARLLVEAMQIFLLTISYNNVSIVIGYSETMSHQTDQIIALARQKGIIRPRDLVMLGLDHRYLAKLVSEGCIVKSGHGLYHLADYDVTESHGLVEAVSAQAKGVVCLATALNFHGIGTQLPHKVWLSVPYGSWIAVKKSVPMRIIVMRSPGYESGIQIHRLEGVDVPIYNIPKTISDCFKFRNKIGLDVALEALREVLRDRRCTREEIRHFAKINRVEKIMQPYMEALSG